MEEQNENKTGTPKSFKRIEEELGIVFDADSGVDIFYYFLLYHHAGSLCGVCKL